MLVPSGRTVSWVGLLKVLLLLMSMLMVVKQKYLAVSLSSALAKYKFPVTWETNQRPSLFLRKLGNSLMNQR